MTSDDFPPKGGPLRRPARAWRLTPLASASLAWHAVVAAALVKQPARWRTGIAALLANHLILSLAGCAPRRAWLGPNLTHLGDAVASGKKSRADRFEVEANMVLTFDDGPDPDVTPRVAALLEERNVRATFFCIGDRVARYPELVRRLHDAGHRIENHTYTHATTFAFSLFPGLHRELSRSQELIARLTGRPPAWFRAPAGIRSPLTETALAAHGLHLVSWTRRGYDTVDGNADRILARLARSTARGDILLLHDGNAARTRSGRPVVLEVLPRLLDHLEAKGLRPGPLPDPDQLP